jgi:hypothetical protein
MAVSPRKCKVGTALSSCHFTTNRFEDIVLWLTRSILVPKYKNPTKWRAPSWSWASTNNLTWPSYTFKFHRKCPQRAVWSEVHDLDIKTKPFGELLRASINIKCKLLSAIIRRNHFHRDGRAPAETEHLLYTDTGEKSNDAIQSANIYDLARLNISLDDHERNLVT